MLLVPTWHSASHVFLHRFPEKTSTLLVRPQFNRATFARGSRFTLVIFSSASNRILPRSDSRCFFAPHLAPFASLDSDSGPVVVPLCLMLPHVERSNIHYWPTDSLTTRLDREPSVGATRLAMNLADGLGGCNQTKDDSSNSAFPLRCFRITHPQCVSSDLPEWSRYL